MMMISRCIFILSFALQVVSGLIPRPPVSKTSFHLLASPHEPLGDWQTLGQVATITSPWLTVVCERLQDDKGQELDYWRVEKDHSVIVLTLHRDRLVFPKKQYRPGVSRRTLDFAGGRCSKDTEPQEAVAGILKRELNLDLDKHLQNLKPLNEDSGWLVNSSFSNQELFGFVAVIRDDVELDSELLHNKSYCVNDTNEIHELLQNGLTCLQCRAVLMEYLIHRQYKLEQV